MPLLRKHIVRGAVDALPFHLVIVPFALIFGVIATEAGLPLSQVMGFSVLVIAGASQLAALQLISENAPTLIVILTALAVNLRMAMYSASLMPHIGTAPFWMRAVAAYLLFDQPYAMTMIECETHPERSPVEKLNYFFGVAIPVAVSWYIATYIGAVAGERLPAELGIEFAVPITFLAVVTPMLRTLAHMAAAVTSVILTLAFSFMPFNLGLLAAALVALCVGAGVEVLMQRRAEP